MDQPSKAENVYEGLNVGQNLSQIGGFQIVFCYVISMG